MRCVTWAPARPKFKIIKAKKEAAGGVIAVKVPHKNQLNVGGLLGSYFDTGKSIILQARGNRPPVPPRPGPPKCPLLKAWPTRGVKV